MPTKIVTQVSDFSELKTLSVSAATLTPDVFDVLERVRIFNLPANIFVLHTYVITHVSANAGVDLKVFLGANEVVSGTLVSAKGAVLVSAGAKNNVLLEEGVAVEVLPDVAVTSGEFTVIVTYIQYKTGMAMFTSY